MALFFFVFHGFLGRLTRSPIVRDSVYLATALGSVLLGYSLLFVSHSQSAASAAGAFILLHGARRVAGRRASQGAALIAGFLAAGTTALEYPCVLVSAILCVQAPVRPALDPLGRLRPGRAAPDPGGDALPGRGFR